MKPVIGIPTSYDNEKSSFNVGIKNIMAIEKNGGIPLLLPLSEKFSSSSSSKKIS